MMIPGHARHSDGMLTIGGIRADILAERYGTPALLLDMGVFDTSLRTILDAAAAARIRASYAAKALLVTALAKRLASLDVGLDVASLGELVTAERGGIESARITLHGAGKTDEEIEAAFIGRAGRLVVDSLDELRRVAGLSQGRSLDVLLRINTGIEAHTHEFIRTAGDDSKFGLAPRDEEATLELLRANPQLELRGIHAHIGSQIFDPEPYVANAHALLEILGKYRNAGFATADTMVIGGGFGVQMHPESPNESIDIPAILSAAAAIVPNDVRLEIEPGRAVVGAAGTSLYRVMAIKRYSKRTFVIVDGSMADNPRPALYGAYHHVVPARDSGARHHPVTVCGRSCENDALADAPLPEDIRAGDLLAFCTTGAYTYSMASNYNRFSRPPIVAIERGEPVLWTQRESIDDVLRNDI